jgi:hypothetical protein
MSKHLKIIQTIILITSIVVIFTFAKEKDHNRLIGKICSTTVGSKSETIVKYKDFKIEIYTLPCLRCNKGNRDAKPLFESFPAGDGNFSFKDVPEGKYCLHVTYPYDVIGLFKDSIEQKKIEVRYNKKGICRLHYPIEITIITQSSDDVPPESRRR